MIYNQGDIFFFDLEPAKGTEPKKTRPCVIVSNNEYNKFMNTVLIVPISSSSKYRDEKKYQKSPFFVDIDNNNVHGTALLQHIRSVDPNKRIKGKILDTISKDNQSLVSKIIKNFV